MTILNRFRFNFTKYTPYSRHGHDGQKARLGRQMFASVRKSWRSIIFISRFCDVTSLFRHLLYDTLFKKTRLGRQALTAWIGLYRENAIAIDSEARDPFGGNVYYVTMQITLPIPEFARKERNLHCDVVHVTTKWVSRLVLDHAIAAIQTSR